MPKKKKFLTRPARRPNRRSYPQIADKRGRLSHSLSRPTYPTLPSEFCSSTNPAFSFDHQIHRFILGKTWVLGKPI